MRGKSVDGVLRPDCCYVCVVYIAADVVALSHTHRHFITASIQHLWCDVDLAVQRTSAFYGGGRSFGTICCSRQPNMQWEANISADSALCASGLSQNIAFLRFSAPSTVMSRLAYLLSANKSTSIRMANVKLGGNCCSKYQ